MTVTESLLRLFRVDQQLNGLQGRLTSAEKFLGEQSKQIQTLEQRRESLHTQIKQLQATAGDHEGESKRLDARMTSLREQMNSAKTNKEYKAFLTEVNTLKVDKDAHDEKALGLMTQIDGLKKQLEELDSQRDERAKVKDVANTERDKRADEIKDRVAELKAERTKLAGEVPAEALRLYTQLVKQYGEDAMSHVEEQDRKSHDFNCGRCMMAVPVETVSSLIRGGTLTRCVSCGVILYIEQDLRDQLRTASEKKKSKASKATAE